MKILFIAMGDSIHTARWINQISDQGWEIHLIPSIFSHYIEFHPDIQNVIIHNRFVGHINTSDIKKLNKVFLYVYRIFSSIFRIITTRYYPDYWSQYISKKIVDINPDIIHTLEFQSAGYLVSSIKKQYNGKFPTWIATNWGSDIYLFGKLPEHRQKIVEILEMCDYYSCECYRDVKLAHSLGVKGKVLPVIPNTGGFDLKTVHSWRQVGKVSDRKYILVNGKQDFAGRGLNAIDAIARINKEILQKFTVAIYSAPKDVIIAARLFSHESGIPVEIIPPTSHEDMLRWQGKARVYIGISISDAIATSLLESILMGSFPIQTCTSCADEWIENGVTGMIVSYNNPQVITQAITRALIDDNLVNTAAEINWKTVTERLDTSAIKPNVVKMYTDIKDSKTEYRGKRSDSAR